MNKIKSSHFRRERPAGPVVIFFLHSFVEAPSSFRRGFDYEPYLIASGIQPVWLSYTPVGLYRYWVNAGRQGFLRTMARFGCAALIVISRWWALAMLLRRAGDADAVLIQWLTLPRWYVSLLKKRNANLIFDFDDAIFLRKPGAVAHQVRKSKAVTVGSHFLYDYARKLNENAVLLPTPVPQERFLGVGRKNASANPFVIGWIGSLSTLQHLRLVASALDALADRYPQILFRLIGCRNRPDLIPAFQRIPCEVVPSIPYERVPEAIAGFDIGIMPLFDTDWDRGKCLGKALEYMAAAVPCVISRVGENVYAVEDGKNGFLASDENEWIDKLSLLIERKDLRKAIGEAGRKTVEERYSTEICSRILIGKVLSDMLR